MRVDTPVSVDIKCLEGLALSLFHFVSRGGWEGGGVRDRKQTDRQTDQAKPGVEERAASRTHVTLTISFTSLGVKSDLYCGGMTYRSKVDILYL